MMGRSPIAQWLLYCADPLGTRSEPPRVPLSPQQLRKLMVKAEAHRVLPATLRNFPISPGDPKLDQVRLEANARKIEALALAAMLKWHADAIVGAAKALPVAVVKGQTFARAIYPDPGLRPFGDIDLLAAPEALPYLTPILLAEGFRRVEGCDPTRMEDKWVHCEKRALMVEVHTNLVHSARMRAAFSFTFKDIEGNTDTPGTLLAIAVVHGATHYFAWLRHVVDICQAAHGLTTAEEESNFEALSKRTGTIFAAVVGLTLAHRLFGERRCLEIAQGLATARDFRFAGPLIKGAAISATMENWFVYNSWRRFVFRELLRYGTLASSPGRNLN